MGQPAARAVSSVVLQSVTDALSQYSRLGPRRLADVLLGRLEVNGGAPDDIALVAVRL
ncbi:hypothetical protein [Actinacidiphila oryziradicis]|uniref:hypothetical protein n=1 Tax=Actinacidiphila oryziradicis TaxID=2571141 RepID=UPI001B80E5C8|nr:hypothetical protein [Actinacidiphila oryziradicis]